MVIADYTWQVSADICFPYIVIVLSSEHILYVLSPIVIVLSYKSIVNAYDFSETFHF